MVPRESFPQRPFGYSLRNPALSQARNAPSVPATSAPAPSVSRFRSSVRIAKLGLKPVSPPMCTTVDLDNRTCDDEILREVDKQYQSTSGHNIYCHGGPVALSSKRQTVAAFHLRKQRILWNDLETKATLIFYDNQGALQVINTGIIRPRARATDIKFHHMVDEQKKAVVNFQYIRLVPNSGLILDTH